MDKIEISVDYLHKLAGMTREDFLDTIQDENGDLVDNYESMVSDRIKAKVKEIREDQKNRGFKAGRKEVEKILSENGIDDFEDLADAINELKGKLKPAEPAKSEPANLTIEEIRELPQVKSWFESEVEALKKAITEAEKLAEERASQFQRYKVTNVAMNKAHEALKEANAANLTPKGLEMYLKALGTNNLDISEDGAITVLDSDGQPMKDDLHNPITFSDYVTKNWAFGFSEVPDGSGSPNHKKTTANKTGQIVFRDEQHFNDELKKAGSNAKRQSELIAAYAEQIES